MQRRKEGKVSNIQLLENVIQNFRNKLELQIDNLENCKDKTWYSLVLSTLLVALEEEDKNDVLDFTDVMEVVSSMEDLKQRYFSAVNTYPTKTTN